MDVEVRLPQWGMGMQEGEVVRWLRNEGDRVAAEEPLAEVEAAKVTEEVLAPAAGELTRIVVGQGSTVPVRDLLAVISTDESAEAHGAPAGQAIGTAAEAPAATDEAADASGVAGGARSSSGSRRASPRVRRLAHELGVDIGGLSGTGPGGMVTQADVRAASSQRPTRGSSSIPLTGTRRTIASRMTQSVQTMAQVTLTSEADVTDLVAARQRRGEQAPTYTAYLVRAAALALAAHPWLNARFEDDRIELLDDIHIGVAVSRELGLIVPVIRDANGKGVTRIAEEIAQLADEARDGALSAAEVTGSTFSVTNLGPYGIDAFTPIINPPEVATLGVGRIADKPVREEDDDIHWHRAMVLSLTFDHRVVDGVPAARFLQAVRTYLENPRTLLDDGTGSDHE
ncbi:MAG: dihydrolipoamide acetyltransferase family protein [Nocardioidaceae bacterium]